MELHCSASETPRGRRPPCSQQAFPGSYSVLAAGKELLKPFTIYFETKVLGVHIQFFANSVIQSCSELLSVHNKIASCSSLCVIGYLYVWFKQTTVKFACNLDFVLHFSVQF